MKKLYSDRRYKEYSKKRAISELKKTRRGQKKKSRLEEKRPKKSDKRLCIRIPEKFSILENTEETLTVFTKISDQLEDNRRLYFDMSAIDHMTLDAVLYIKSIFDYYHLIGKKIDIKGNSPENPECNELLLRSGLFDDVRLNAPLKKIGGDILQLQSGNTVERNVVKGVIDFTLFHLGHSKNSKSRSIYRIILEMMGNTHNHAYKHRKDTSKWYLISHHEKNDKSIKFAFLDAGYGIPTTIKKYPLDKVKSAIKKIILSSNDPQLIDSALNGDLRTRTEQGYRGKGLPSILKCYKNKHISDLKIISNKGCVDGRKSISLNTNFQGTLFTWNFI